MRSPTQRGRRGQWASGVSIGLQLGEGQESGGKLKIITELEQDTDADTGISSAQLKIMFIDNGPGIAEETLANIFDPFFTTKDPGRGTGLGLSVSFMIVESLGGKMTGTSEVGQGTTMIISLPLCKGS